MSYKNQVKEYIKSKPGFAGHIIVIKNDTISNACNYKSESLDIMDEQVKIYPEYVFKRIFKGYIKDRRVVVLLAF